MRKFMLIKILRAIENKLLAAEIFFNNSTKNKAIITKLSDD